MYFPLCILLEMNDLRSFMFTKFKAPEQGWNSLFDFWITVVAAIFIKVFNQAMNYITWNYFYTHCKEKDDEEIRLAKTEKACNSFFQFVYFSVIVVWGHIILREENFFPPELLGQGSLSNLTASFPHHEFKYPLGVKYYYLITLGYHLASFIEHAMSEARNDFVEMYLHHLLTIYLYSYSYLMHRTPEGAIIMHLHDFADVPTQLVRCFVETTFVPAAVFGAVSMLISWGYTRLYVFPFII